LQEEQVRENHILEVFESEKLGKVRMPRPAARFDRTPAEIRTMAPYLGSDNTAILGELGYGADEIARFENAKIVRSQIRK